MSLRELCSAIRLPIPNPHAQPIQDARPDVRAVAQHLGGATGRQLALPQLDRLPNVLAEAVRDYRDAGNKLDRIRDAVRGRPVAESADALAEAQHDIDAAWVGIADALVEQREALNAWAATQRSKAADRIRVLAAELEATAGDYTIAAAIGSALAAGNLGLRPNEIRGILALDVAIGGTDPQDPRDGLHFAVSQLDA